MEPFETTLTGSDGLIDGVVTPLGDAYQFTSLDDTLYLTIVKDEGGNWVRTGGSEPYFSGWIDELADHIANPIITAAGEDEIDDRSVLL